MNLHKIWFQSSLGHHLYVSIFHPIAIEEHLQSRLEMNFNQSLQLRQSSSDLAVALNELETTKRENPSECRSTASRSRLGEVDGGSANVNVHEPQYFHVWAKARGEAGDEFVDGYQGGQFVRAE